MEDDFFIVTKVKRAIVNGKTRKIVTVYSKRKDANVFNGEFTIPIKVARDNILAWLTDLDVL